MEVKPVLPEHIKSLAVLPFIQKPVAVNIRRVLSQLLLLLPVLERA